MTSAFHIAENPCTTRYLREAGGCALSNDGLRIDVRRAGFNTVD